MRAEPAGRGLGLLVVAEPAGRALDLAVTLRLVHEAASRRAFLGYGDVAAAHGAPWPRVRRAMPRHLTGLVALADARGWPVLSAIVVNGRHRTSGRMEPETLAGFTAAVRAFGHRVEDPEVFLRAQQEATFRWAAAVADPLAPDPPRVASAPAPCDPHGPAGHEEDSEW